MTKLRLEQLEDDKPVKLTVELPAQVHRDLVAYAEVLGREGGSAAVEPARLIAPMLARFMATDREFAKRRRAGPSYPKRSPPSSEQESSGEHATGSETS